MLETNKIYCGDCYDLLKKIDDKSIDCIYTDIPYLYKQDGGGGCFKGKLHRKQLELSDIKDGIDFGILKEFVRVMKKINCFIWCSRLQIMDIMNYFSEFTSNYEVLVWCKTNPLPTTNNRWLCDVEYCLYFREKGVELKDGYKLKSKYYESGLNQSDKILYKHPTIKPLNLVKRHLEHALVGGG